MEENNSRKVFLQKQKSNGEDANSNSEVQSQARSYQQQQGEQIEEKPNSPLNQLLDLQDNNQQQKLSRKFVKTAQLLEVKDQSSPQSIAGNMCAQQQLKKSVTMGAFIVQQLIEHVICRFQALVDMFDKAGQIAIRQTLNVLINDPNLGLSNGHMLLPYHITSTLAGDYQPKATATIEGSSGHVKIKQIPKKQSTFRLTKQPSIQKEKEKQKQKPNKRTSKYNSLHKKNSLKQNTTLPPILQRYQSLMPDLGQSSKTQKFFDKENKKEKIMRNFRNSSNSKMQADLINIANFGQQNEDNFINYLRFVKVQAEKYWSLNSVQRSQFINQYNPNIEISTLKNSNPLNSKQICRRNSLSNIQHSVLKQLQQKMNNQTRKLIPSNFDNNYEQGIIPVTTNKKGKNYQSYISVQEKQQFSDNIYSFDASHIKQGNRSKIQSKKTIQMSNRTDISNTSFHYLPSKKPKKDIFAQKPLNKSVIPKQPSNQMIKLPFIPIKNKKSKREEELSVWMKNRQKNKEYDKKFMQFINHNLCASNSISQIKTNPIEQIVQTKQQQKKRVSIKVSQKQNKKILKKHVQIDFQEVSKKYSKRTRKSLQNVQFETNTYRL